MNYTIMNMKFHVAAALMTCLPVLLSAQHTPDTVEIELARSSKIVFTMEDSNDLWQLKHYDFQALFDDILAKLEKKDTAKISPTADAELPPVVVQEDADEDLEAKDRESYKDYEDEAVDPDTYDKWTNEYPTSRQYFNMDFGINNYAPDKNSPETGQPYYTVHPWGSWNIALNAMNRTRFSQSFSLETSLGVSWYNFKFEEDNTFINQTPTGVIFIPDQRNLYFTKSKLTVSYVNLSLIPVLNTGPANDDGRGWHRWGQSAFRIGLGPYIGYRLGSHSKQQYELNGDKQTEKVHDDFYLQNFRYGLRFQIGIRGADFFVNYDLNELFTEGNGPELHPFSFGFIF
jgi:hypothetical protein